MAINTSTNVVLTLEEAALRPITEVGAKAANLARLKKAGFPVPDGFVITTAGFIRFVEANGLDTGATPEAASAASLPPDVSAGLESALERLETAVAVRSSGVSEDLAGASYAGQYESVLDVETVAQVGAAVLRCWASAFDDGLLAYHRANGGTGTPQMAVLVQKMVPAEAAGVAFSADPVSGDREVVVINAVSGLGDRLVAGEVDGEHWTVRAGDEAKSNGGAVVLRSDQAASVATLAREVEDHFGSPQDIEWAMAGGNVYLLQARPITALPPHRVEVPVEVPEGYWVREASHSPRPWSRLASSLAYETRNDSLRQIMADFGLLVEGIEFREIGGWEYVRTVPLGGKDRPAPPAWLMPILIRVMPAMRARIRRAVDASRGDEAGALVDRWHQEWHPELRRRITSVRSVDLAALSDADLLAHYWSAIEVFKDGARIHFTLHAATCMALAELMFASTELLGWEEARVWELLVGLSQMSSEPGRRLGELAEKASVRPETRRIIEEGGESALDRLCQSDPDFVSEFMSYMEEYGTRSLDYDAATPTLSEDPVLVMSLIADQLGVGNRADERDAHLEAVRGSAQDRARAALMAKPPSDRERWERALVRAQHFHPVREDNVFYTMGVPPALVRYAALEIGRRLAARDQVGTSDDVFFLHCDEVATALADGEDRKELVAIRRGERAWMEAHPGPATYGKDPGPPPPLDPLPPEARFANQALLWYAERLFDFEGSNRSPGDGEVRGTAASPGQYQGPVRVIRSEAEFHKLRPGDVLVCPITSPVWSVLFPAIGGLVTDTGGVLSHPAIIAREHRVPAVVATGNATDRLKDGQLVTVNGDTGVVTTLTPTP